MFLSFMRIRHKYTPASFHISFLWNFEWFGFADIGKLPNGFRNLKHKLVENLSLF